MTLFIACILIYQFDMHWGFYVVAIVFYLPSFITYLQIVAGWYDEDLKRQRLYGQK